MEINQGRKINTQNYTMKNLTITFVTHNFGDFKVLKNVFSSNIFFIVSNKGFQWEGFLRDFTIYLSLIFSVFYI